MDTKRICPHCGQTVAPGVPEGLCPECMLKAGLGSGVDLGTNPATGAGQPRFTPPTVADLAAKFPQLEILKLIGQGGMGAVYQARQKQLDRFVALKILPPDIGRDAAFAERFTREARALAKLNHPGIVTIHDFGCVDGLYFFLMEFVDGVNLRQLLAHRRVSTREALAIVPQICDALQFAHDQGIVHRDIKPDNILMDRRGRVKVADFGLAKIIGHEKDSAAGASSPPAASLTEVGKVMGTPQYMSPEQIHAPGEVDHRADIYALGVVFYQMLTGELPGQQLQPPSQKVQLDVRLDEIVLRALAQQPELRYQQASLLKTQIETLTAESASAAGVKPKSPSEPPMMPWIVRPEVEDFWLAFTRLFTPQGLLSAASQIPRWLAKQVLLLLDFTAIPRPLKFWPALLLFGSNIGFGVNAPILLMDLVMRWLHGAAHPFVLPAQEHRMLMWALGCGLGRLVAMNGYYPVAGSGPAQAINDLSKTRVLGVLRKVAALAALMAACGLIGLLLGKLMVAYSDNLLVIYSCLAQHAAATGVAGVILGLAVVGFLGARVFRFYARLFRKVNETILERAKTEGQGAAAAGSEVPGQPSPVAGLAQLSSDKCYLSSPRHVRSFLGRFIYIYQDKGTVQLTPTQFEFVDSFGVPLRIPLLAIQDVRLGEYSRCAKPGGLNFISVTYQHAGRLRTHLFTPYHSSLATCWATNRVVAAWFKSLQTALATAQAAAGATPDGRR